MSTSPPPNDNARRPYSAPMLVRYGDVRAITRADGGLGDSDGGAFGKIKTDDGS